jgi:hydrogenase-4 component B
VAICGLPPLNGFISEFLLYSASIRSVAGVGASLVGLAAPVLAVTGALAVACFVKVIASVFLGHDRSGAAAGAHECGWSMRAPMLALALPCIVLGVVPTVAAGLLDAAASAWAGALPDALPSLRSLVPFGSLFLVVVAALGAAALAIVALAARARRSGRERTTTWGCGFTNPTARMQYSASSLAQALVQLFRPVMPSVERRPGFSGPFPGPTWFGAHVEDIALHRLLVPLCARIARAFEAVRRLRSGRTQAYILSIIITTIGLMISIAPLRRLVGWLLRK